MTLGVPKVGPFLGGALLVGGIGLKVWGLRRASAPPTGD